MIASEPLACSEVALAICLHRLGDAVGLASVTCLEPAPLLDRSAGDVADHLRRSLGALEDAPQGVSA